MNTSKIASRARLLIGSTFLILLLAGCARTIGRAQFTGPCTSEPYADLSGAAAFVDDGELTFRFPLDDLTSDSSSSYTLFCTGSSGPESSRKYHAAEDFFRPAGSPVYAMADGTISFSGPMGGYGWLIIVDHPQANLYSLYGHLSPSRDRMRRGTVEKGTLIAYLGDAHENGGSARQPLEPHLHLGVRAGQRADYPGKGEWRWQAGWIKLCPTELGWLPPSAIITAQGIPAGGFSPPTGSASNWLAKWGIELSVWRHLFRWRRLRAGLCAQERPALDPHPVRGYIARCRGVFQHRRLANELCTVDDGCALGNDWHRPAGSPFKIVARQSTVNRLSSSRGRENEKGDLPQR